MNCDAHEFVTFSTCLKTREVMANCVTCGAFGVIQNPTRKEWVSASSCVRVPLSRVTIKSDSTRVGYLERNHGD